MILMSLPCCMANKIYLIDLLMFHSCCSKWLNTEVIIVMSIRKWFCYLKPTITITTPVITILLSPCPSSILSSIFLPDSCHLSQHYFSNSVPLPTLIALSYKTYSNHHHIQPFSAHWFWAHTCSPNINSSSTLPFTAPLPFFIIYVLLGYSH